MSTYRGRCGKPWSRQTHRPPAARATAMHARMTVRLRLVVAEDIALFSVGCVIRQEWIGRRRIEAEDRAVPAAALQHHYRRIVGTEQPKDAGGLAGGIVQDHRWGLAFGCRIEAHHQTISARTVIEEERGPVVRSHRELRAYLAT